MNLRLQRMKQAIQVYPMYENAIRYARGETMDDIWLEFQSYGLGSTKQA